MERSGQVILMEMVGFMLFLGGHTVAASPIHQRFDQILQSSVVDGSVDYMRISDNADFAQYLSSPGALLRITGPR